jgi:hypothetical protein
MKTAVEWLIERIIKRENGYFDGTPVLSLDEILEKAKEMEKEQLLQMSLKSAHYERKWILEHSTESQYNPSKVEIRDLEKTALEHYNETFKQEQ